MRFFLDTEFYDRDGALPELISIGLVAADGREYYAEDEDWEEHWDHLGYLEDDHWLRKNVRPYLYQDRKNVKPRELIRDDLISFCGANAEFWAWFGAYDWVLVNKLMGGWMKKPRGWPDICHDVATLRRIMGRGFAPVRGPDDGPAHHALSDARWTRRVYNELVSVLA